MANRIPGTGYSVNSLYSLIIIKDGQKQNYSINYKRRNKLDKSNYISTRINYNSVYFTDSLTGWVVGDSGIILKTTTGGILTNFANTSTEIPDKYFLSQNYPNPFNPVTNLEFGIPELEFVSLKIFDVLGNEVSILVNENKPAGRYEVTFNGTGLPSGIYYYKLTSGNYSYTRKMMLIK
ncbi:MAG: T9SS type A sorting domain-containing protein [Ignavibacteria bacterium]|nr:T9SS type A sorting domain-containing protein [Ignavibacteria bacterium]